MSRFLALAAVACLGSAAQASIWFDLVWVDNSHVFGAGVWDTYDLVAHVDPGSAWTSQECFAVTDGAFYEHPLGTDVPQPDLWGVFPELEFDCFYAVPPDFNQDVPFFGVMVADPYYRQATWADFDHDGHGAYIVARYTVSHGSWIQMSGTYTDAAHGGDLFPYLVGPLSCLAAAHPASQTVPALGGEFRFEAVASPLCGWTVSTDADWVTIDPNWSGLGRDEIFYTVAPNDSPTPRSATIQVENDYPMATHVIEQAGADPSIPGDLNGDGCVDQEDLGTLLASYGIDGGGDVDGDGMTGQADLGILLAHWGEGC
ncbi:MAG: BACON domain-containing protein [Phycisphaerales bacterium JB038]